MSYDRKAHLAAYNSGTSDLRVWFLSYGIGAPLLFLSNKDIYNEVISTKYAPAIVILFLSGVALQIFISILNKYINWVLYCHYDETKTSEQQTRLVKASNHLSNQVWIDFCCDLGSTMLFGIATVATLLIFV